MVKFKNCNSSLYINIEIVYNVVFTILLFRLPQQAILQWHRLEQTPKQELYPSFDALNQLASIPWTINKPVIIIINNIIFI